MIYFPNYILELLFFFFSTFYSIYLLLKLKSEKNKNFNISFFFFNFISINFIFFCFFLSSSSIIDTIFQSIGNTADLPITKFFYFSLLNFFIFFLFLKSTRFKNYLRNSQFLYSIIFFFFLFFFSTNGVLPRQFDSFWVFNALRTSLYGRLVYYCRGKYRKCYE